MLWQGESPALEKYKGKKGETEARAFKGVSIGEGVEQCEQTWEQLF